MISIIIPTINRYSDLKNTILFLEKQNNQNFEIIIIDQTPLASFEKIPITHLDAVQIHKPQFSSASKARNLGLLMAKYEIVLFLDDDVIIEHPTFLDEHLKYYLDPAVSGVFGAVLEANEPKWRTERHVLSGLKYSGWLFFPPNYSYETKVRNGGAGNLSLRRDLAISIGGMNENFEKGAHREESDFCLRYTDKFGLLNFSPGAYLLHIGRNTGGIRSWNLDLSLKGQHNYNGAIYFILNCVPLWQQPLHWAVTLRYFFPFKVCKSPLLFSLSCKRFLLGFYHSFRMLKEGPQYCLKH